MSRDRQHRFRWETTRALGAAIRTICAPAPGTTLAGNDRPRAFPNRRPEVHNYPLGATSTPVFEKDLLRADGDGTGRSTHANQVLFAKYARSYIAINNGCLVAAMSPRSASDPTPTRGSRARALSFRSPVVKVASEACPRTAATPWLWRSPRGHGRGPSMPAVRMSAATRNGWDLAAPPPVGTQVNENAASHTTIHTTAAARTQSPRVAGRGARARGLVRAGRAGGPATSNGALLSRTERGSPLVKAVSGARVGDSGTPEGSESDSRARFRGFGGNIVTV